MAVPQTENVVLLLYVLVVYKIQVKQMNEALRPGTPSLTASLPETCEIHWRW